MAIESTKEVVKWEPWRPNRACCGWMGLWEFLMLWSAALIAWDILVVVCCILHATGSRSTIVPPFWLLPEHSGEVIEHSGDVVLFDG